MAPTVEELTKHADFDPAGLERVSWRLRRQLLEIVDSDHAAWARTYAWLEGKIRAALGDVEPGVVVEIHHVGSTSVPHLPAKNVVDVDLVVADPSAEADYVPRLERAGFRFLHREPAWQGHRFFVYEGEGEERAEVEVEVDEEGAEGRKEGGDGGSGGGGHAAAPAPFANLHVFGPDSAEVVRHILFRDWLRDHGADRDRYAAVKRESARASREAGETSVMQYNVRKEGVVREILDGIFRAKGLIE